MPVHPRLIDNLSVHRIKTPSPPHQFLLTRSRVASRWILQPLNRICPDKLPDRCLAPIDYSGRHFHSQATIHVANSRLHHRSFRLFLSVVQTIQEKSGRYANNDKNDRKLKYGARPRCRVAHFLIATLPRSHSGRKMPSARIMTMMPKARIRIGSICCARVFSSYSTSL